MFFLWVIINKNATTSENNNKVTLSSLNKKNTITGKDNPALIDANETYLNANKTINCYYVVYGERKDINKLEVER